MFPKPWRIEINPFGKLETDPEDNIFIVAKDGTNVCIIAKHPVWTNLSKMRLEIAKEIVFAANSI